MKKYVASADKNAIALFEAIEAGSVARVRSALAAGADANAIEPIGVIDGKEYPSDWPALHKTVLEPGRVAIVRALLAAGAKPNHVARNMAPLDLAAKYADARTITALIESGSSVAARTAKSGLGGGNPLHMGAQGGKLPNVDLLIEQGASLESVDSAGCTPLHEAVFADHAAIVKRLLDKGAKLEARTNAGQTPLFYCQSAAMAKLLLARGADANAVDKKRKKPVDDCSDDDIKAVLAASTDDAKSNKAPPSGPNKQSASNQRQLRKNLAKMAKKVARPKSKRRKRT